MGRGKPTGHPDSARSAVGAAGFVVAEISWRTGRITLSGRERATDGPEWMTNGQVAEFLGVRPSTWRTYVSRGQAPQADDPDLDRPAGRRMPRWRRSTIVAWRDRERRPGNFTNKLDGTRK